jgi:hypothetical protein
VALLKREPVLRDVFLRVNAAIERQRLDGVDEELDDGNTKER